MAEVAEVHGRYAGHLDQHNPRYNYSPRSHLTAIFTAAAAALREQRRPKTDAGRGKRARGGPGRTRADGPGRFPPPAPAMYANASSQPRSCLRHSSFAFGKRLYSNDIATRPRYAWLSYMIYTTILHLATRTAHNAAQPSDQYPSISHVL